MKFQTILKPAALISSLISTASSQTTTQPRGNCTVFNWEGNYFFTRYSTTPNRISDAQSCPERANSTQNCALTASGDLLVQWRTNISSIIPEAAYNTPTGSESFLHNLIRNTVNGSFTEDNPDFNITVIGTISQVLPLEPGTSGYINFYPLMRCVVGTMTGCTGGVQDGLGIEACAPVATRDDSGLRILDGRTVVQNVSEADVGGIRDPFAGQTRGGAGLGFELAWGLMSAAFIGVVGMSFL